MAAVTTELDAPNNAWSVAATGVDTILLGGPSRGYRFYVGPTSPGASDAGFPVTSEDGTVSLAGLGATNVYVRSLLSTGAAKIKVLSA